MSIKQSKLLEKRFLTYITSFVSIGVTGASLIVSECFLMCVYDRIKNNNNNSKKGNEVQG